MTFAGDLVTWSPLTWSPLLRSLTPSLTLSRFVSLVRTTALTTRNLSPQAPAQQLLTSP